MSPTPDIEIERFVLGPFETNCYLLRAAGEADAWVIDAGYEPGAMLRRIDALGADVRAVLLTHAHADHIAGLAEVRARFPEARILVHRLEAKWLADPVLNLSAGIGARVVAPAATETLEGGETLTLAGCGWEVLHTPGHSPGGVTFHCTAKGVAFVGDTLFAGSIGRFDFPTSSEADLFASIRDTLYALPDATRVLPGHMGETTIGREKRTNPYVRA